MKLKLGIRGLDSLLGGVEPRSLILIHEADPASLGKLLAFEILKAKLDSDNLVGYFNIGTPLPVLLRVMRNVGIDGKKHLREQRLMIIDTFGSIYGIKTDIENIWYLKKSVDIDTLNDRYIDVLRAHKEKWKQLGMFEGRELWGITISMSDYLNIFGLVPTQRYLELSDLKRATSDVYRKYPAGTNVWVYSGNDTVVLPLIYRKADYILRTESTIQDGKIRRFLSVLKAPGKRDVPWMEYFIKDWRITFPEEGGFTSS